jgi:hypothetical protein
VLLETSLPAEAFEREAKMLLAAKLFEMVVARKSG